MSEHSPPGRRRAHHEPDEVSHDPASYAALATMWRGISRAQDVLGRRRLRFENTMVDDRLAEQFALVAMLHDWRATTVTEAEELAYLLDLYVEPALGENRDDAAEAISSAVRRMAVRRAKGELPAPPGDENVDA